MNGVGLGVGSAVASVVGLAASAVVGRRSEATTCSQLSHDTVEVGPARGESGNPVPLPSVVLLRRRGQGRLPVQRPAPVRPRHGRRDGMAHLERGGPLQGFHLARPGTVAGTEWRTSSVAAPCKASTWPVADAAVDSAGTRGSGRGRSQPVAAPQPRLERWPPRRARPPAPGVHCSFAPPGCPPAERRPPGRPRVAGWRSFCRWLCAHVLKQGDFNHLAWTVAQWNCMCRTIDTNVLQFHVLKLLGDSTRCPGGVGLNRWGAHNVVDSAWRLEHGGL